MRLAVRARRASSSPYSPGPRKRSKGWPPPRDNAPMRAVIAMAALLGCSSAVQAQHHEPVADVVNLQAEARGEVVRKALKAKSYNVRELNIGSAGGGPRPLRYEFAAQARAAPVAIEAGLSQVTVTVSGSIQLQR